MAPSVKIITEGYEHNYSYPSKIAMSPLSPTSN
jgi:hypothetical protein